MSSRTASDKEALNILARLGRATDEWEDIFKELQGGANHVSDTTVDKMKIFADNMKLSMVGFLLISTKDVNDSEKMLVRMTPDAPDDLEMMRRNLEGIKEMQQELVKFRDAAFTMCVQIDEMIKAGEERSL